MIKSYANGYQIEYKNNKWIYNDTKEFINNIRPCRYCGLMPSNEGYDSCIGFLPGVSSACCGHGINRPYVKFDNGKILYFENINELKTYFNI